MTLQESSGFHARDAYLASLKKTSEKTPSSDPLFPGIAEGHLRAMKAQYEGSCQATDVKKLHVRSFKDFDQLQIRWQDPKYWEGLKTIKTLIEKDEDVPVKILFWEAWPLRFKFKIFGNPLVMKFDNPKEDIKERLKKVFSLPDTPEDLKVLISLTLPKLNSEDGQVLVELFLKAHKEVLSPSEEEETPSSKEKLADIEEDPPEESPLAFTEPEAEAESPIDPTDIFLSEKRCMAHILSERSMGPSIT